MSIPYQTTPSLLGAPFQQNVPKANAVPQFQAALTVGHGKAIMDYGSAQSASTFRIPVVVMEAASDFVLHYGNYLASAGLPSLSTNTYTVKAGIQLADASGNPTGNVIPVFFAGSRTGTVTTFLKSDTIQMPVTPGQLLFIHNYVAGTGLTSNYAIGETNSGYTNGSDVVDAGSAGAVSPTNFGTLGVAPMLITGTVAVRSGVFFIGDSFAYGKHDVVAGLRGWQERAMGPYFPMFDGACPSLKAASAVAYDTAFPLWYGLRYCRDAVIAVGFSDFVAADTAANVQAFVLKAVQNARAGGARRIVVCTVPPYTDSTDSYTSNTNQTIHSAFADAPRQAFNTWVLAGFTGADSVFDLAAAVASPTDPTKYAAGALITPPGAGTAQGSTTTTLLVDTNLVAGQNGGVIHARSADRAIIWDVAGNRAGLDSVLTSFTSGDAYSVYSSLTSNGASFSGFGHAAAALAFPVRNLST